MYLELTDEQEFLVEAATGTLSRHDTLASAREALDGAAQVELWRVACHAGWPGLLSGESVDGAGLGAYEAMLVLQACGERLADARLLGHLPAVALLELADDGDFTLRRDLASGDRRAAFVDGADAVSGGLHGNLDGGVLRLHGSVDLVLDAPGADLLVACAGAPGGSAIGVVEAGSPGVSVEPRRAYDATRALARVSFDGAGATVCTVAPERIADGRHLQRALLAAESVGGVDACLRMARDYAVDRHTFGRPIGSYQAIKHKLVEIMRRAENGRSLLAAAGGAWHRDRAGFALAANAARVVAADALDFAAPENIFIHGGIGATWEHDAQLYYRRAEVSRRLAGGPEAAAEAVAAELLTKVEAR